MKSTLFIFISIFAASCVTSQSVKESTNKSVIVSELDSAYVAKHTYYFTIENHRIKGKGKPIIQKIINKSQFIVLGESHGTALTSEFTQTIIPMASKAGFNHFSIEVGPHSANKLKQLSNPYENTKSNLFDFYSNYQFKEIDDIPIPFFHGIEDAKFLTEAAKYNFDLWGLDQEYWSSVIFLMDELLALSKEKTNYEEIKSLKIDAEKTIKEWMIKEDNDDEGFAVFSFILKEKTMLNFFNIFNENDIQAKQIIADLKISWDIYDRYRGGESHNDRIEYMRSNFKKNYDNKLENNKLPKVLLKFGALHASKILSGDTYDIGNLTEEIAKKNGTISTNIKMWHRYYESEGKTQDLLTGRRARYIKKNIPFILQAKKDQWAIIDLKTIKKELEDGKIKLAINNKFKPLMDLIYGFDYELILPVDRDVISNYK